MNRPSAQTQLDPAADAARLLRRIGFATLALVLPLAALVSRRAAVVLVPIGIALLIIAALIEEPGQFIAGLKAALLSRPGLILLGLIAWSALSLVWSPYPGAAAEKAGNLALAVALGFVGLSALPERMRASNLNLAALGTGVAGIFALGLIIVSALRHADAPQGAVERGVSIILIMAWPALAWLLSRERGMTALGLALIVGLLALTRFEDGETMAMIFGAVAFGAVTASREGATKAVATIVAFAVKGSSPDVAIETPSRAVAIVVTGWVVTSLAPEVTIIRVTRSGAPPTMLSAQTSAMASVRPSP